jgi:hypothetical protein
MNRYEIAIGKKPKPVQLEYFDISSIEGKIEIIQKDSEIDWEKAEYDPEYWNDILRYEYNKYFK